MTDPVGVLKRDHREVAVMLKTLAHSRPGQRRRATTDKLVDALTLHMAIEEADVYPLVRRLIGTEDAREAEIEHGLMRDGVAQLQKLVDEPGFGAAVAMVTAGIRHHVKEEETEMFPELKKRLDRTELLELGDQVALAKRKRSKRSKSVAAVKRSATVT